MKRAAQGVSKTLRRRMSVRRGRAGRQESGQLPVYEQVSGSGRDGATVGVGGQGDVHVLAWDADVRCVLR